VNALRQFCTFVDCGAAQKNEKRHGWLAPIRSWTFRCGPVVCSEQKKSALRGEEFDANPMSLRKKCATVGSLEFNLEGWDVSVEVWSRHIAVD